MPKSRLLKGLIVASGLFAASYALMETGTYGWTVFGLVPMAVGGLGAWVNQCRSVWKAAGIGAATAAVATCALLLAGLEGLICIAMALPFTSTLGGIGGAVAYYIYSTSDSPRGAAFLMILPAVSLGWDVTAAPPAFELSSEIVIDAPPEQIWPHIVAFPPLDEAPEWFFRAGIAYPTGTRIEGAGVGARRYCDLSTGPALETVEIWEAPRVFQFAVHDTPAPMRELSPYGDIQPRHLHGYMQSERGRFVLTPLAGGRTRVTGTSWYRHGLWPAQYWRWWSDAIGRRVQMRVLRHIRRLAESE